MNNRHVIQKQVFDINFNSEKEAYNLQNKISRLFYSKVEPTIDTVLSRVVQDDILIRLNYIEIDLGNIPYHRLDDLLADRLKEALEKELAKRFPSPTARQNAIENNGRLSFKVSFLNLLEYFLMTGTLPWWTSGQQGFDVNKVIKKLLEKEEQALKKLLLKVGQSATARRRLIYQTSDKTIQSIVEIIEPAEADFIFEYHREIVKTQKTKQPVQEEESTIAKTGWLFIFTYLLTERGSNFNRKIFVKSTLGQLADHYNIQYEEILELFAIPVHISPQLKESHFFLSTILKELLDEQLPYYNENKYHEIKKKTKGQDTRIRKKEDLINYYLQFGTFPMWAAQEGLEKLNKDFEALIREVPEIARDLILYTGNKENAIQNIILAFDATVLTGIITLVEPSNASFIIRYVKRVKKVQQKKSFAGVEEKSFTQSVWQFVLTYLLIDRGSLFNTRMFLESNIRRMAHQYNLEFEALLTLLINEVKEENNIVNITLFHLLNDILASKNSKANGGDFIHSLVASQLKKRAIGLQTPQQSNRSLLDILRFRVRYGHFPWWGKCYAQKSTEEMWKELVAGKPQDALKLIQFAGTELGMKQRLIYQLSEVTFFNLFSSFPDGQTAKGMYELIHRLLGDGNEFKIKNKPALQNILQLAWWDSFRSTDYQAFDSTLFINLAIQRLAQWTGLYSNSIRYHLINLLKNNKAIPDPEKYTSEIQFSLATLQNPMTPVAERNWNDSEPDIRITLARMLPNEKANNETAILNEAVRLLDYYLQWNKWPDYIQSLTKDQTERFLQKLLQLLAREKPVAFRTILQNEQHLSATRMQLHNLVAMSTDGDDKKVQIILQEFQQKDLFHYLNESFNAGLKIDNKNLEAFLEHIIFHPSTAQEIEFLRILLNLPVIIRYITTQFGEDIIYNLIESTPGKAEKPIVPFLKQLKSFLDPAISTAGEKKEMELLFRRFNLQYFTEQKQDKKPDQYFNRLFILMASAASDKIKWYKAMQGLISTQASTNTAFPNHSIGIIQKQLRQLIKQETQKADYKRALSEADNTIPNKAVRAPYKQKSSQALVKAPEKQSRKEEVTKRFKEPNEKEKDTIYVNNAGLVLFHPFLSTYFSRLELMEKGKFVSEEVIVRGVHLLQFLVDGKNQHPEHELVLNKILCGMSVEEPIPASLSLNEEEKKVSEELLNVIKERWDKMKNTSIESFRVSFLQREGVLTSSEDAWHLRVEQRGYDVILQTLPWSFGMIKTSWMEKILYVEWA